MKRNLLLLLCVSLTLGAICNPTSGSKWKSLLGDGFSLAKYEKGSWKVEGDVLTAYEDKVLWASGEFENFVLELEFKNEVGTNSGVIIYCTDEKNWIPNSVEIQIADDYCEKWGDARKDFQCGAVFGHLPANKQKVVNKPGEWNKMKLTCKGQLITVELNGKKVTRMDMSRWTSGKVNPDGSEIPGWLPKPFAELPTKGSIGFQGKHGDSKISFKNIRIKSL